MLYLSAQLNTVQKSRVTIHFSVENMCFSMLVFKIIYKLHKEISKYNVFLYENEEMCPYDPVSCKGNRSKTLEQKKL